MSRQAHGRQPTPRNEDERRSGPPGSAATPVATHRRLAGQTRTVPWTRVACHPESSPTSLQELLGAPKTTELTTRAYRKRNSTALTVAFLFFLFCFSVLGGFFLCFLHYSDRACIPQSNIPEGFQPASRGRAPCPPRGGPWERERHLGFLIKKNISPLKLRLAHRQPRAAEAELRPWLTLRDGGGSVSAQPCLEKFGFSKGRVATPAGRLHVQHAGQGPVSPGEAGQHRGRDDNPGPVLPRPLLGDSETGRSH